MHDGDMHGGEGLEEPDHEHAPPSDTVSAPSPARWSLGQRIGFRFLATYFLLYTLPFPLDSVPWLGGQLSQGIRWLWEKAAVWTGHAILGIEGEIFRGPTGSGDTTFDYLKLLLTVVLVAVVTLLWSLLDRKRTAYPRSARWLVVGCRFYLGIVLLGYGLAKVIPAQFSTPSLTRLLQPYGASSPMGIVWTFMGLSPAYTIFSGLAETVPALLLLFRRTRLLGATLAAAVMTNVVMLNYCFDVPVKLFSSHLLVFSIALVLLDGRRLTAFFLRNQPAPAADLRPLFTSKRLRVTAVILGGLLVSSVIWENLRSSHQAYKSWGSGRARPAIWGIHDVESFRVDGEELPPLLTDETRWLALVVDRALPTKFGSFEQPGFLEIQHMDGKISRHATLLDEEARTFTFLPKGQTSLEAARQAGVEVTDILVYELPEPGRMIIRGTFNGREIEVTLHERDLGEMLLISRGYHWINELPFNK